jgi:23S rRNA pseudouridine1911/1915/1917 synthase
VVVETPEALARINAVFQSRNVTKLYWAVTDSPPPEQEGTLEDFLSFDPKKNKAIVKRLKGTSPATKEGRRTKKARLNYRIAGKSDRYVFLEIELITGRHHQIRAQLAASGCHIKGDLKYGAARSNPGGGIHLHARLLSFRDPQSNELIEITAPPPKDVLWDIFPH